MPLTRGGQLLAGGAALGGVGAIAARALFVPIDEPTPKPLKPAQRGQSDTQRGDPGRRAPRTETLP